MFEERETQVLLLVVGPTGSRTSPLARHLKGHDLTIADLTGVREALLPRMIDLALIDLASADTELAGETCRACRVLRSDEHAAFVPILAVVDDEQSVDRVLDAGANLCMTRPLRRGDVLAAVHGLLAQTPQALRFRDLESRLSRVSGELRASEDRYRLAMELSFDGAWDWNLRTDEVQWGPCSARFEGDGLPPTTHRDWADLIHPDDRSSALESLRQHLDGRSETWVCEYRLLLADGSWAWMEGRGRVVSRTPDGAPDRMIGTFTDISERKTLEELTQLRHDLTDVAFYQDLNAVMRTALDRAEQLTESRIGFYHFVDVREKAVSLQVWSTRTMREMCSVDENETHYPLDQAGVWVDAIHRRQAVIHDDYESLPHKKGMPPGHPPVTRELTVPVFRDGEIVALLGLGNKGRPYDERDQEVTGRIADMTYEFVERKRSEDQVRFMAFNDTLTGLPNRELLHDRLQQAIASSRRTGQIIGICYLDLDGFKPINDRFGHEAGDAVLVRITKRLVQVLREGDTLARVGGDEFALILTDLNDILDGERITTRLLHSIREPVPVGSHEVSVTGSIGVTYFPSDDSDPITLLRHADKAMYRAKATGGGASRLFDPVQEQELSHRLAMFHDLQRDLRSGCLVLYFQPRIDLRSGTIIGVEALLRWPHLDRGLLLPRAFLHLAEGRALEFELGEWIIRSALEQHLEWETAGLHLPVSVNIGSSQLERPGFSRSLERLTNSFCPGISTHLELEVPCTEGIERVRSLSDNMRECAKRGVRFSLDGYSGGPVSALRSLPFDSVKIHKDHVRRLLSNAQDLNVVEHVLESTAVEDRSVVAVGVESRAEGIVLLMMGCTLAQGFCIAPPMPANQVPGWVARWSTSNPWRELGEKVERIEGKHDFGVSVFCHRTWVDQLARSVREESRATAPNLEEATAPFHRWYHGVGKARYGSRSSFAFLPPKHARVEGIAKEILELVHESQYDRARERLDELLAASEELVATLMTLQQ
ncbi:MAG: EAL domain-containing protein [Candidatus Eisenbacteria bacterium]|nr:EAL domain-containing protein [Candidatus Eisenbacteria bacterium]